MNIISNVLNYSLNYYFNATGDLGIAIALLTISVRLVIMPLSLKQKLSIHKQQNIVNELQEIKKKYKNNKKVMDIETQKYYKQNAKGVWGMLTILLQIPVIFNLYNVVLKLPFQAGTVLLPWLANLKMSDSNFIVPVLYALTVLAPNILAYIPFLRVSAHVKISKINIIISSMVSILITFKAPAALGIYLITTSLFSFLEEVVFRVYIKKSAAAV